MKSLRCLLAMTLVLPIAGCPIAPRDYVYFLVSDPDGPHGDSYVLPLHRPEDIAHARALIADRETEPIVLARIARGAGDPPNQNLAGDGETWSWHVVEFLGFADFTIEIYDGWPGYVEDNLDAWFANTGGIVGFWNYTVTDELAIEEN